MRDKWLEGMVGLLSPFSGFTGSCRADTVALPVKLRGVAMQGSVLGACVAHLRGLGCWVGGKHRLRWPLTGRCAMQAFTSVPLH